MAPATRPTPWGGREEPPLSPWSPRESQPTPTRPWVFPTPASPRLPSGDAWAKPHRDSYTSASSGVTAMNGSALAPAGGGQPHNNLPPYLVVNFVIALQGISPARS